MFPDVGIKGVKWLSVTLRLRLRRNSARRCRSDRGDAGTRNWRAGQPIPTGSQGGELNNLRLLANAHVLKSLRHDLICGLHLTALHQQSVSNLLSKTVP